MIVTEPYLNFTSTQEALSEIFFEEYEVDALLRINGKHLYLLCFIASYVYLGIMYINYFSVTFNISLMKELEG